jgi:hypothetical protein
MFNRFFCFLFLAIVGLNIFSFNVNLKSQAADLQKPYISEVWAGDSGYTDKCAYDENKINSALKKTGFCGIDFWIEITNPTSLPINLSGYEFDLTANYLTQTINATKLPTVVKSSIIIAPNSNVLFQTKYGSTSTEIGNFQSMLTRAGITGNELNLTMPTNVNKSNFSFSFYGLNGLVDSFSSSFVGANASIQICLDENGNKKQTSSTIPFQAGVKTFYGTPGAKNDCPEIKKNIPTLPVLTEPPSQPTKSDLKSALDSTIGNETNSAINPVFQVAKDQVIDNKLQDSTQTNIPTQAQTTPLPIPKIEIKAEPKKDAKRIEPVTFKVQPETIPVLPKIEKPLQLITPAVVEVKKDIVKETLKEEIVQKPIIVEPQKITKPIFAKQIATTSTKVEIIKVDLNKSVISQTKVINMVDEKQTKLFGVDITKPVTVDMHTIKVNFIYFDLALILFLVTKTTLDNKRFALQIFDLARQKFFQVK